MKIFCPKCGKETDSEGTFCAWCGTKLGIPSPNVPAHGGVDARTGVPLNPEDILRPKASPQPRIVYGIPIKMAYASIMLTILLPVTGFLLGYFLYDGFVDGIIFAGWTFAASFFTGRVIGWMVQP